MTLKENITGNIAMTVLYFSRSFSLLKTVQPHLKPVIILNSLVLWLYGWEEETDRIMEAHWVQVYEQMSWRVTANQIPGRLNILRIRLAQQQMWAHSRGAISEYSLQAMFDESSYVLCLQYIGVSL